MPDEEADGSGSSHISLNRLDLSQKTSSALAKTNEGGYSFTIMKKTILSHGMPAPVEEIAGVWKFERRAGSAASAHAPVGHTFHYIDRGVFAPKINHCRYELRPGDLVYYGSGDLEEGRFPVDLTFYSVVFYSESFEPLPLQGRVLSGMTACRDDFVQLEQAFRAGAVLDCFSALYRILAAVQRCRSDRHEATPTERRWRAVMKYVRQTRQFHPDTGILCRKFNISRATLLRDCRRSTGLPPVRYFKLWRLEEALALLRFSDMNVSEVAAYLGYRRIHEFSRDFSAYFGHAPSAERRGSEPSVN